jgi:seryl-tRNA synthetase
MKDVAGRIDACEASLRQTQESLEKLLLVIPNIVHASVPAAILRKPVVRHGGSRKL